MFDERLWSDTCGVHFLLLLKLFGFSSDNLLKFMQKKFNGNHHHHHHQKRWRRGRRRRRRKSTNTRRPCARGTRVTLCRVFVRLNAVFIQQQRLLLSDIETIEEWTDNEKAWARKRQRKKAGISSASITRPRANKMQTKKKKKKKKNRRIKMIFATTTNLFPWSADPRRRYDPKDIDYENANKRIALVGNGRGVLKSRKGERVDSEHDLVGRFNFFVTKGYERGVDASWIYGF